MQEYHREKEEGSGEKDGKWEDVLRGLKWGKKYERKE